MVDKIIYYKMGEGIANAVRKVLANISDADYRGNFGLSDAEIDSVHIYLRTVEIQSSVAGGEKQ